jgi:P-type Cu+ transporter
MEPSSTKSDGHNAAHADTAHHACCGHKHEAEASAHEVKDPVCGMSVDPHTAKHRHTHEGHP